MFLFRKKSSRKPKKIDLSKREKKDKKLDRKKDDRLRKFVLRFTAVIFILGLGYVGLKKCNLSHHLVAWQKQVLKQPVKQILFHTDGNLTALWCKQYLSLPGDTDILDVDIAALQQSIGKCSQVKKVTVMRKFPDTISIEVEERKPILRVMVQEGRSKKIMFIDGDGVVFPLEVGENFTQNQLPFLSGIDLTKEGNGYRKVPNVDKVQELLVIARAKYWPIYAQIEVVEMSSLTRVNAPWSKIKMRCQFASQVIFKDSNFDEQLKRLDFILNTPKVKSRIPVNRIDLTYPKDAVVRFRK